LDVSPVIRSQLGALIAELSSTTRTAPVDDDAEDFWMDEIGALGAPQAVFLASSLAKCGKTPDNIAWLRDTAPELRKIIFDLSEATLCLSHQGAHVRSCSNKISQIVAGVKSYAVLDQEPVQDIDVNASLDRAISVFQGTLPGTVVIARSLAEDLRTVQGPALELNLVWTSLLDNARAALPATGGLVTLRTYRDGPLVAVEVTDNGCGIPDDLKDRLFEPFFTTRDVGSGVGLGLFMSRRIIVERFGGDIRIRSRPGETTVLVHL
jgi:signal transduction histidine kinase